MTDKIIKIPDESHPITIEPTAKRVIVTVAGQTIADSASSVTLCEAAYPPVLYIPREDADMSLLQRSEHSTYCPYKGDCNYYSIPSAGTRGVNAVWTYEAPYDAVVAIKGHLAFYPDRVDLIDVRSE